MTPMRILVLAPHPFFSLRGTPIAERLLLEAVTDRGHRVDVLTYHEGEDPDLAGVRVHRIPAPPGVHDVPPGFSWKKLVCDVFLAVEAARIVRRHDYDLVHAVEESAFLALLLKKWRGIPFVYDRDSDLVDGTLDRVAAAAPLEPLMRRLEGGVLRESLAVLTVGRILEERVAERAPDTPVFRVEDASLVGEGGEDADALRALTGSDGPIVLYVGNLQPVQGIDLLLEAWRTVAREAPDARLVVVGGSPRRIGACREAAGELGVAGSVHFAGPRPLAELGGYLRQATVLVSPRRGGVNTPMKIYSYLDSGRPVVATRLPTHTQVLDDGVSRLVDPTPEGLARGLVELLDDPDRREELAAAAGELVEREYSRDAFRRKIDDAYRRIEELHPAAATPAPDGPAPDGPASDGPPRPSSPPTP